MARGERSIEVRPKPDHLQAVFVAMGSPCELLVESGDRSLAWQLAEIVAHEAWRIEDTFSRYLRGNIVDRINRADGRPVAVDEEAANLIDFASTLTAMSHGRFDITSGVLREVWTFDGSDRLPARSAVTKVLERVGWHKISWDRPRLSLLPGMQIDLGGIGKEYAVDRAAALLRDQSGVPCLINFGGDILATATSADRRGWQVGIETPDARGGVANKIIRLKQGGLATSGDARRFLMKDGVRYGHILDPTTGWPVVDAPRSITIAADTCTQAGMLATLAMLNGANAESFLQEQDVQHWCYR